MKPTATRRRITSALAATTLMFGGAGVATVAATTATAAAAPTTVYVATTGHDSSTCGTSSAPCATIGQGVTNASAGDTVSVAAGTYNEQVVVPKTLMLVGHSAVVDPKGATTGSGTSMDAAAIEVLPTASGTTIQGFTVQGATGEGILVVSARHVTIRGNQVSNNDIGTPSTTTYAECQPQGNVPGDCGEGIHLMSADLSTVIGNSITQNSGGVLVTDELGPAFGNLIANNYVAANLFDCGITLPSHSTTAVGFGGRPVPSRGGVYGNRVLHNRIIGNGILGDGAGVLIAAAAPGGASYNNLVANNVIYGNGLAGVTLHAHAPRQYISGNVIQGNLIGTNNVSGDPDARVFATTGVLVYSAVPRVHVVVVIRHNVIIGNFHAIWTTPNVRVIH